jgi:hypothetical protein
MNTMIDKAEKEKIDWLLFDENQPDMDILMEDFRQMVYEAEKDEGMSLSTYKQKMDIWWQKHI